MNILYPKEKGVPGRGRDREKHQASNNSDTFYGAPAGCGIENTKRVIQIIGISAYC
jgi:hypothetical protein